MSSFSQKLSRLAALFAGNQNGYGLPLSNRNYFVDGNFDSLITPAGVALTAGQISNTVATMYYGCVGTGGAGELYSAPFIAGTEPTGMTSPMANALYLQQTTASTGVVGSSTTPGPYIMQRVEGVNTLQNRSATFSCWLWTISGTAQVTEIGVVQNFGTGGTPSAQVLNNVSVNWTVTTTPQRFSVLLNIPSISSKTIGTSGLASSYLQINIWLPVGTIFTIGTTQWQLEQSSPNAPPEGMPTTFEYRGVQAELARVQRYYGTTQTTLLSNGGSSFGGDIKYCYFPVTMRVAPSVIAIPIAGNYGGNFSIGSFTSSINIDLNAGAVLSTWVQVNLISDARL